MSPCSSRQNHWCTVRSFYLVVLYGLLHGSFYSCLLPLWEGFDEPFHYGYVQELALNRHLPSWGESRLSAEVTESLKFAPGSYIVQRNLPFIRTYQSFHLLTKEQQSELRRALTSIPPQSTNSDISLHNYEAHHAPLAYILLAPIEWSLGSYPLIYRILLLRILSTWAATLVVAAAVAWLVALYGGGRRTSSCILFCLYSTQMFWGTVAHICNDWLAIPLGTALLCAVIQFATRPTRKSGLCLGLILGAGLLTKAYFLALVPIALLVLARTVGRLGKVNFFASAIALLGALSGGVWYLRNLLLFGSFSGMAEHQSGLHAGDVVTAIPMVPWIASLTYQARGVLWTGNNSFQTFSQVTLNLILALAAISFLRAAVREMPGFRISMAYLISFGLALAYSTALSFSFTNGESAGASPWYAQFLYPPVLTFVWLGVSDKRLSSRCLASALLAFFLYMIPVTYFVKLMPLYGWNFVGKVSLGELADRYFYNYSRSSEQLDLVCLAFGRHCVTAALIVSLAAAMLCFGLAKSIWEDDEA